MSDFISVGNYRADVAFDFLVGEGFQADPPVMIEDFQNGTYGRNRGVAGSAESIFNKAQNPLIACPVAIFEQAIFHAHVDRGGSEDATVLAKF